MFQNRRAEVQRVVCQTVTGSDVAVEHLHSVVRTMSSVHVSGWGLRVGDRVARGKGYSGSHVHPRHVTV